MTIAPSTAARRLLLVHAHPDDETINNGATMAKYVADGVHVTLVTCTRGEEGEVLVPELAHLAASAEDGLGAHREGELAAAMAELGVTDFRFLGGPGRFRDTGMAYAPTGAAMTPATVGPGTFWLADLREAADLLVEIIREVRPQVLVTYDENGGYGHPDHVQAHRVATYATALAAAPSYRLDLGLPWSVEKVYWAATPRSVMAAAIEAARAAGIDFFGLQSAEDLPFAVDDELVTTRVDGRAHLEAKLSALRAHATQITPDGPFFAMSKAVGSEAFGDEYYRLVQGQPHPEPEQEVETDLFAGINAEPFDIGPPGIGALDIGVLDQGADENRPNENAADDVWADGNAARATG